jgi:hypothetical protein
VSDQPPYYPPSGNGPQYPQQYPQPGGEQPSQQWPGQYPGAVPPVYPPPPEHYTQENYPPLTPDAATQYPPPGSYPQYAQYPSYQPYPPYPQQGMYGPPGYGMPPVPQEQGSGLAVAGLILGIISIPAALVAICGLIFGIIGIILSALGRRSVSHRTMATIGLTLAIIGVVLSVASSAYGVYYAFNHPGLNSWFTTP